MIFDMKNVAERLQYEVSLLREWFKRDYPESDLRVNCDFNGVLFSLNIQISVLMGEEVASDRLLFKSQPIRLVEKDLRNHSFMDAFFKEFNKQIRMQIQTAFNAHYQREQQKIGL